MRSVRTLKSAAINAAGALAAILTGMGEVAGYITAAVVLLMIAWRSRLRFSMHTGARVMILVGCAVAMAGPQAAAVVAGAAVITAVLHESTVKAAARPVLASGISGLVASKGVGALTVAVRVHTALLAMFVAVAALQISSWWVLVPSVVWTAGLGGAVILWMLRPSDQPLERRRAALAAWEPVFAIHFSGPVGSTHQVTMWLPYLQRVNRRYVIIAREAHAFHEFAKLGEPVVHAGSLGSLEASVVPSLRAVFYVNNGMKNTHLIRFANLTHVQLLHGDSDKPPSYSPVTAMYDRVFVAGQAGRDRYRQHGVDIPDQKFVIVGRPQVEGIAVAVPPRAVHQPATVLYAPTWRGQYDDSNFCSLPLGAAIVRAVAARGDRVVFRPHPFSASDPVSAGQIREICEILAADEAATGRGHVFGPAATGVSIIDAFNDADALISDVSSVASDFLFSGKPMAVVDTQNAGSQFTRVFPLADACYVIAGTGARLPEQLDLMLTNDPLWESRQRMRSYYLGPFAAEGYAGAFIDAARSVTEADPDSSATYEDSMDDDDDYDGDEDTASSAD